MMDHNSLVEKSTTYLTELGWNSIHRIVINNRYKPDKTFEDDLNRILFVEVKPIYSGKTELYKGVAQTLYPLTISDKVLSLLVIPLNALLSKDYTNFVIDLFKLINTDRLFVITYNNNDKFEQIYGNSLKTSSITIIHKDTNYKYNRILNKIEERAFQKEYFEDKVIPYNFNSNVHSINITDNSNIIIK